MTNIPDNLFSVYLWRWIVADFISGKKWDL